MAIDTSCNVSLRMDLCTLNTFFIAVIKYLIDTMRGGVLLLLRYRIFHNQEGMAAGEAGMW